MLYGGRVEGANDGDVGSPHRSGEAGESQWSEGGNGLGGAGSRQLALAFADSSSGDRDRIAQDESRGWRYLLYTAKVRQSKRSSHFDDRREDRVGDGVSSVDGQPGQTDKRQRIVVEKAPTPA
jgi:hypothetical protein